MVAAAAADALAAGGDSSSPSDLYNKITGQQSSTTTSLSYAACDVITRHLISMLLEISNWTNDLAKYLAGSEQSSDDGHNERCLLFSSIFFAIDPSLALAQMSSVASKHALLIALGGFSIAALFVWYINKKDKDGRKKKKVGDVISNGLPKTATASDVQTENGNVKKANGHVNGDVQSSIGVSQKQQQKDEDEKTQKKDAVQNEKPSIDKKQPKSQAPTEKKEEKTVEIHTETEETDHVAAGDSGVVSEHKEHDKKTKQKNDEPVSIDKKSEEIEVPKQAGVVNEEPKKQSEETVVEEQFVKKEEPKLKIPEEPTPTKMNDATSPLSLDIAAQMSPASFSWSEEMEKSFNEEEFRLNESSDIDRSPASPLRHLQQQHNKNRSSQKRKGGRVNGRDGVHQPQQQHQQQKKEEQGQIKKGQRRLTKEKSVEETPEKSQKRVVLKHHENEAGDAAHAQIIESPHHENASYEKSDSPGLDSQNSEASSQDSGRATGPLASPHEDGLTTEDDFLPMYEFEIPNSLVGLIIGVKGKTIKELSVRTNVRMLIRQHHETDKVKTHQICQVRGKRDEINHCLQMLRRRFPPARFPELNLQPVVPPVLPNSNFDMLSTQPTWLTLPEDIKCEVAVSSIISASHFFIQQPTHPSFASLRHLDMYMGSLYGEQSNLPELPIPCQNGLLCAAPVGNAWFRAVTVQYFDETDEVFVKFVDYGGYSKMARQDLRQIRTDLMSLPFQSTEVMLAHVRPVDGTTNWSDAAMQKFRAMCIGKVINCKMVGQSHDTRIPMVELYMMSKDGKDAQEVRFDQVLMNCGLARTADPSKMSRITVPAALDTESRMKRPSFSSQTSQTAVVC
ncbi:Tudor domain-containing protein [Caenorhabditis elegans]|uniref:Tudor domain-containing protein n=1 Tax=Caenorhabditis elegans TaxID=6239 RepID=A0A2K5ATU1_CAEEL|nr:Tudor domain-containing protein [Caenorhabditis elegans]SPC47537.1 Tudor domain-containing protein [Caenorhabditis elegans]|eukprot:NP_001348742.1 KH domain-containing protein akap-1 [Caenorhabditis elegans]